MTFDREGLKSWYREAMQRRLEELRTLREGLKAREASALDTARAVGQALRGSGATYGFPELSAQAGLVESAPDGAVARRVEGLIESLRRLSVAEDTESEYRAAEWLALAAGGVAEGTGGDVFPDLATAWEEVGAAHGLSPDQLAERVAEAFGLRVADLSAPKRSALRLVPEAFMAAHDVVPLREDAETISVATADPTSLALEDQIQNLTGRTPILAVAPPGGLSLSLASILDGGQGRQVAGPDPTRASLLPERLGSPRVAGVAIDGDGQILVVDDDPAAVLVMRKLLEKGGYGVLGAEDGVQALERLRDTRRISLVVADLNMPKLDGLELIWEMRAEDLFSAIPVIVVTGETDEILEAKLIEEGADDYIRKPLDPRLFLARVAATIRRAEH